MPLFPIVFGNTLRYTDPNRLLNRFPKCSFIFDEKETPMKFGYFDDKALEYVITTPRTPLPWINYLGCNDFFSIVSNTCGGYRNSAELS